MLQAQKQGVNVSYTMTTSSSGLTVLVWLLTRRVKREFGQLGDHLPYTSRKFLRQKRALPSRNAKRQTGFFLC
jgi:hypothetical protein